ncbi:unnamed protein product [Clonostachys rosea f. rosea IK726]|uniref:Uncharacterized protein n=1 Tax=Clonostachys rosea f. rosea IK726 TaxID=1349383 RepID=A0ACA9U903_BIOOC|nr:unnamed protein product [Clonostachys rosea f. rosea IK726]
MVGYKNLSLAGLLWLGLASRGLALGTDEATNDLTLVGRSDAEDVSIRDFDDELYERDFDEELDERDFDEELDERDFEDELDERDFDDFDLPLQVRGGASINFKERVITGRKNTVNKQPNRVDMKAHDERTRKHISGPAPY